METATKADVREIMTKISKLQKEVNYLKEHIDDVTLSSDDIIALEEAERDFKTGKTISHEKLKKELEL